MDIQWPFLFAKTITLLCKFPEKSRGIFPMKPATAMVDREPPWQWRAKLTSHFWMSGVPLLQGSSVPF